MARPFSELREKMTPKAQAEAESKAKAMMDDLPLAELRQARKYSQDQIAGLLDVQQASISKMERRTDMYISTLRSYVKAMGGELEITAHFPEGDVKISQFKDLGEADSAETDSAIA